MVEKLSDVWELWGLFLSKFYRKYFRIDVGVNELLRNYTNCTSLAPEESFSRKMRRKMAPVFVTKEKCVSWPSLNFKLSSLTGASSSQSSANVLHTSQLFLIHSKFKLISLDHFGSFWVRVEKIRNFRKTQIKSGSDSVDVTKGSIFLNANWLKIRAQNFPGK